MIGIAVSDNKEWEILLELYNINSEYTEKYIYGSFYRTVFKNNDVIFFKIGKRKVNAAASIQYMIDKFKFEKIILVGTCTLVSDLDYNDIIVPSSVVEYDLTVREVQPLVLEKNIIELNKVSVGNDYVTGLLGTSDKALMIYKDYLKLKDETEIVASDTESAAVAKVCKMNNVDLTIIKGVTDKVFNSEDGFDEQVEVYEENLPVVIKNILENYLTEVIK